MEKENWISNNFLIILGVGFLIAIMIVFFTGMATNYVNYRAENLNPFDKGTIFELMPGLSILLLPLGGLIFLTIGIVDYIKDKPFKKERIRRREYLSGIKELSEEKKIRWEK